VCGAAVVRRHATSSCVARTCLQPSTSLVFGGCDLFLGPRQPKALHVPRATRHTSRATPRTVRRAPRHDPRPTHPRTHAPRPTRDDPHAPRATHRAHADHLAGTAPVTVRHCQHPRLPRTCSPRRGNGQERTRASRKSNAPKHRARHRAKSTGQGNAPRATADEGTRTKPSVRHGPDSPDRHQLVTNEPAPRRNAARPTLR